MQRFRNLLLIGGLLLTGSAIGATEPFTVGDIWSYQTRPGENASTLTILKVEQYPDLGQVVHIRVDGIHLINPLKGNQISDIPHLPFRAGALQQSVTQRVGHAEQLADFSEGYTVWKTAYDAHQAGAFKTSVAQTLNDLLGGDWEESR